MVSKVLLLLVGVESDHWTSERDLPFVLHEISVLIELTLGHLSYYLSDVPPCWLERERSGKVKMVSYTFVVGASDAMYM